jgi:hypothetical protein
MGTYKPDRINKLWNEKFDFKTNDRTKRILQIIRCGIMAPSSYNNQPWLFKLNENSIEVIPDFTRKLKYADPKNRELFISLGCCLENMWHACNVFGFKPGIEVLNDYDNSKINIILEETERLENVREGLFQYIIERKTTRCHFKKKRIASEDLETLDQVTSEFSDNISLIEEHSGFDKFLTYQKEANRVLFDNKEFANELEDWQRFSDAAAERKMDGLYSRSIGESATSDWLGKMYFDLSVTSATQNKKDENLIRSSSGIINFFSGDNILEWIQLGMFLQKYLLELTKLGLKYSFLSSISRVEALRRDFAADFNHKGLLPQTSIRIGYSDYLPRSPRRQISDMIVK